ncbi:hypothetical protein G6F56_011233 [Rhizopus delemar]|nr:hypothetical protein G6F56_011233 [Rhizopus delemar]
MLQRRAESPEAANARWRQVSDRYLYQIRFYEAGFSAVMHESVAETNDEDDVGLADEGVEDAEDEAGDEGEEEEEN